MAPAPLDAEQLLREREARGLRVPLIARLLMVAFGVGVVILSPGNEDATAARGINPWVFLVLVALLVLNLYLLRLLRRSEHVERVGWIGAGFDAVFVIALSVLARSAGSLDGLPPTYAYKSELPAVVLTMVVINALALRPRYPSIVGVGALVALLLPLVSSSGDAPTTWAYERAVVYSTAAADPGQIIEILLMAVGTILAAVFVARSARQTILKVVESEVARAELQEAHLREVMREKVQAMSRLVAGISHEVNTPLGALGSSIDTQERVLQRLLERLGDEGGGERFAKVGRQTLDTMRTATERIRSLESSLRALSHLDEAEVREIDLAEELDLVIAAVGRERGRPLRLERSLGPLPELLANASELNQALASVLSHCADEAGEAGTVTVRGSVLGGSIRLEIGDDGPGLDAASLGRIFDVSFERGGERVSAGFGLAAAQSIAHRHGGELSARSAPGEGTTFVFELPFATSEGHPR